MAGTDKDSSDDVRQLFQDLRIEGMQYREFAPAKLISEKPEAPQPAPAPVAVRANTPAPPPAKPVAAKPAPVEAVPPPRAADAPRPPRATAHESPLNFTFERLRRQVAVRAQSPALSLDLPPRRRHAMPERVDPLAQRRMLEVFSALNAAAPVSQRNVS